MTLTPPAKASTSGSAVIDGQWRYQLIRRVPGNDASRRVLWVMLNPSTADAMYDDPTIRRVLDFSRRWGFGWVEVVNLFALRSTDPRKLTPIRSVGPSNQAYIDEGLARADEVIVAWGNRGAIAIGRGRFRHYGAKCLGVTIKGEPKHPLYCRATATRVTW